MYLRGNLILTDNRRDDDDDDDGRHTFNLFTMTMIATKVSFRIEDMFVLFIR